MSELEIAIAAKMNILIEGIAHNKMSLENQRGLSMEIVSNLKQLIVQTIREEST